MTSAIRDKDLQGVEKALRRAGTRARKIAEQTNTPLVIYKDGKAIKKKIDTGEKNETN